MRKSSSPNLPSIELQAPSGFLDESIKPFDLQDFDRYTADGVEVRAVSHFEWRLIQAWEEMVGKLVMARRAGG